LTGSRKNRVKKRDTQEILSEKGTDKEESKVIDTKGEDQQLTSTRLEKDVNFDVKDSYESPSADTLLEKKEGHSNNRGLFL
jgi:hypothetical protein